LTDRQNAEPADSKTYGLRPESDPDATLAPSADDIRRSDPVSIGPYHLLTRLGEGGMGQVWLAQQFSPVKRQVALKLIKGGRSNESIRWRFDIERQSLAMMNHPFIARVFDAGATADGQPYFAMEYVPGPPITDYCNQKHLNPRERIELFLKICQGVQHAHQKAILHRDLKPSNILVAEPDGVPVPRIIDFGIAKAIQTATGGPEETSFTEVGIYPSQLGAALYSYGAGMAVLGHPDEAILRLQQAVEHGFVDADQMAADDDWRPLRGDARFQALLGQVRKAHVSAQ